MQRRPEFSFPGSPARGLDRAMPPVNAVPPRPREEVEEEVRWLQASRQGSPDCYYNSSSGTPSPPLWANHGRHPPASAGSSPPSRAQAIAGYRREMLDLVRGLPESAYELSLRDIVEHRAPSSSSSSPQPLPTPPPPPPPSNAAVPATEQSSATATSVTKQGRKQRAAAVRRQRSRSMERSVSLDTGLLIKFFLPLSIGRAGKKKVSPKPDAAAKDGKKKNKKKNQRTKKHEHEEEARLDEDCWTKSEAGSSSRTSSTGSSNSTNGSIRNGQPNGGGSNPRAPPVTSRSRSRKRNGCYAFFRAHKSKDGVSQD